MHEGKTIEQLGAMVSKAAAKHTPGPWFYEGPDKGDSSVGMAATQGYIYVEVLNGTTEVVLATIHEPMYVDGGSIDEENFDPGERYIGSELANGPIFAAAPELLAALKAESFVHALAKAKDRASFFSLLESAGDTNPQDLSPGLIIEKYTVKAALLRHAAIAKAEVRA